MNSSFNILTPGFNTNQCQLSIFINNQGVSFVVLNANNVCVALVVYHFSIGITTEQIGDHLKDIVSEQSILQQPFKKISFIYAFPESVLVPHQFFNAATNKEMLELVYGDTSSSIIKTDFIIKNNLHNVYCIPKSLDVVIAYLFPVAYHCHIYSILQNITQTEENYLYCIIETTQIIVQVIKENKLQMVQTFAFNVPEDISYYLLSVCKSFDLPHMQTAIFINGIIDESAAEIIELQRYFPIQYGILPKSLIVNDEIKKYPGHYFNYLFELSTCV